MHQIRTALRGKGVVLMGKNTMVRRALRNILAENPQYERLLPHVKGNVGFVFTSSDLKEVRDIITANKVKAPARAGAVAPIDVVVSAGNTGMEPGKTSFFQALSIPTKIARGTIEIVSDIKVVVAGTKVGPSEATLLNMLNISPFTYGMTVAQIYSDGGAFPPSVLDIDEQELIGRFLTGIKTVACISLALNYPTLASVSHSLVNAYKNLVAVALETEYSFEGAEKVRSSSLSTPPRFYYVMNHIYTENSDRLQWRERMRTKNLQSALITSLSVTTIALALSFPFLFLARSVDQELTNANPTDQGVPR
jgi:large subunit ribosomal protein LP0